MAKAASEKTRTEPEKPIEAAIPEASEEQKEQQVVEEVVDCKAEKSAADKSFTGPEVANAPPKGDAVVAEVTTEVAGLKVSEPVEPETATAKTPAEATTAENNEGNQMQTSAETEATPEAPAEHKTAASISATNDGSVDTKDEDETW